MNCAFLEADPLHPPANIDKMSGGTPLTDVDREPWLEDIAVQDHERTLREHFGSTGPTFDINLFGIARSREKYQGQICPS